MENEFMKDKEICNIYNNIKSFHKKYLEEYGVKLPALKNNKNLYTKDALTLVFLAKGYPNTECVSKTELTNFIKKYYPNVNDVQQARHLAAQKGWYILSGTRNDNSSEKIKPGYYKLKSLEECYPGFTAERRNENITGDDWNSIKEKYDYKCACCGSEEGKPHRYMRNVLTRLQKGHKNPNEPLENGNIIPQCEICNRADRNYWIYNDKGRVIKIANAKVIDSCSNEIKKAIYQRLYNEFNGQNPKEI